MTVWEVPEMCQDSIEKLVDQYQLHPAIARCLVNRIEQIHAYDLDEDAMDIFLGRKQFCPPDPYQLKGMDVAVERIRRAVENGERICIFGDYDADGVTATSILMMAFNKLGADVFYYIPDRFGDGVGLTCRRVDELIEDYGAHLVITVDTGCRCVEEVHHANARGLDIIITDHHLPGDIYPDAVAMLNPKAPGSGYPYRDLCGAGVAYKLVEALNPHYGDCFDMGSFVKIASIGTIADMVPLQGENRWLVCEGLKEMARESRGPLRLLLKKLGVKSKVFSQDVSYKIAPRINAPGRLGAPDTAIAFFLGKGASSHEIGKLIDIMDGMNQVRQMLERDLESRLDKQIRSISNGELPPFIMFAGKNWHRGILGITACKMLRKYSRPVCVLSYDAEVANGSLRGLPGINLIDTLKEIESLFTSYGGHAEAAGVCLDVTNLPQFKQRMNELLAPFMENDSVQSSLDVDCELNWSDIDSGLFQQIMTLEPFGAGNPLPQFLSRNLILEMDLQRSGPWLSFEASDGVANHKCSYYHPDSIEQDFEKYDSIDLIYSIIPFRDEFQIQVSSMRLS